MKFSKELQTYSQNSYLMQELPLEHITAEELTLVQPLPARKRDVVELLFVRQGTGKLLVNGVAYALEPGNLLRSFPFHLYEILPDTCAPLRLYRCGFPLSLLMYIDIKKRLSDVSDQMLDDVSPLIALSAGSARQVEGIFEELVMESTEKKPYYYNLTAAGVIRLLAIHSRETQAQKIREMPAERTSAWRALQMIHMYFNKEGFDAAFLADQISTDPARLGHMLRLLTGQGFTQNLHEARIRNACAMMRFEELSIAYIARFVGYGSLSTFHRIFKAQKGCTPDQYRVGTDLEKGPTRRDTAWGMLVYLLEHDSEDLRLADLAERFYLSEATAAFILKANFNMGFPNLLERIRLSRAQALLGAEHLQICDIALSVGFNSLRTFNRSFYKHFGTTPQRFRGCLRRSQTPICTQE